MKNPFNITPKDRWQSYISQLRRKVLRDKELYEHMLATEASIDDLRSRQDVDESSIERFHDERLTYAYRKVFSEPNPLVTVCIATFNRSELLISRAVHSILNQSYQNFQLIVVGDGCTDDTEVRMAALRDSRVQFINLQERGKYPEEPSLRWMVAGTYPMNTALSLAEGSFITHLDDDDCHAPQRIETLLRFIQEHQVDFVWHPFWTQGTNYRWRSNEAVHFKRGSVSTSSIFYHRWFKQIPWDIDAYRYREPGDWNRLRKIRYLGARCKRHDGLLLQHFRERSQKK